MRQASKFQMTTETHIRMKLNPTLATSSRISSADAHSRPSGTIVSPDIGQLTPAQVMTSPRALTMSLPWVLKGPYGQTEELPVLGTTSRSFA